jgi:hypothetical protein
LEHVAKLTRFLFQVEHDISQVVEAVTENAFGATAMLFELERLNNGGFDGAPFMQWVMDTCRWIVQVVLRPERTKGFVLLKKRWVVEGVTVPKREKLTLRLDFLRDKTLCLQVLSTRKGLS